MNDTSFVLKALGWCALAFGAAFGIFAAISGSAEGFVTLLVAGGCACGIFHGLGELIRLQTEQLAAAKRTEELLRRLLPAEEDDKEDKP